MNLRTQSPTGATSSGSVSRVGSLLAQFGFALCLAACVAKVPDEVATAPTILAPQTQELRPEELKPGLAVRYWFKLFRDIRELEAWMRTQPGTPGAALEGLDHVMGSGLVLTSDAADAVGAEIAGFIQLPHQGRYVFFANSNDGVRVEIGGVVVANDPDVHPDRLSTPRSVIVASPGWYALRVLYFERRNTATLQLFWVTPTAISPSLVPASALRHR